MRQFSGHFYVLFSMSAWFLIAVDTLSNKTNNLIDDPDPDYPFLSCLCAFLRVNKRLRNIG